MGVERRERRKVIGDGQTECNGTDDRSEGAKQIGEIYDRWPWVEATVWTPRMLTALETGIKGGKWFSLIDKVYKMPNLRSAFGRVRTNGKAAGVDQQTIEMFEQNEEANLANLSEELREGRYRAIGEPRDAQQYATASDER